MADSESVGIASPQPVGLVKKCSVCAAEVSIKSEPFLLPCLHTACKACLPDDQLTVSENANVTHETMTAIMKN